MKNVTSSHRLFWAKSGEPSLSLIAHMLDTAAVAREILFREPESTRERLAGWLGAPGEEAVSLTAFFCGLHDMGKASPAFQIKWEEGCKRLLRYSPLTPPRKRRLKSLSVHHGPSTEVFLSALLPHIGFDEQFSSTISRCLGAHHGLTATPLELRSAKKSHASGDDSWKEARSALLEEVMTTLSITPREDLNWNPAFFVFVMGLTSVADWLASSEDFFPYGRAVHDPRSFFLESSSLAKKALDSIGWLPAEASAQGKMASFEQTFGFAPNALQKALMELLEGGGDVALLLIEAPMGGGKTEAALYAHLLFNATSQRRGFYFALPTQATGNSMFARVKGELLSALARGRDQKFHLQLQHGCSILNEEYVAIKGVGERGPGGKDQSIYASEWFSQLKRAMLAPYGVGTIDQALLSILQVRHHFVRLFGLFNRTVILDEVHAYDAYTSGLLKALTGCLKALKSPVIVMSATLPEKERGELLKAAGGLEKPQSVPSYPRITVVDSGGAVKAVQIKGMKTKKIRLANAPMDIHDLKEFLTHLLSEGDEGALAFVANTVDRAQQVFSAFGQGGLIRNGSGHIVGKIVDDTEVYLFHARFSSEERQARENQVVDIFGKRGQRPKRAILIATQVVEQSLDLDFDSIVTDLAPVDLLLQRLGRMHRHDRARPPAFEDPTFYICGLGERPPDMSTFYWDQVYYRYLLLMSWWKLRTKKMLFLPEDIDSLVNAVYSREIPSFPEGLGSSFKEALEEMGQKIEEMEAMCKNVAIARLEKVFSHLDTTLHHDFAIDDTEEPDFPQVAMTRLGGPSIKVIPVFESNGGLFLDREATRPVPDKRRLLPDERAMLYKKMVQIGNKTVYYSLIKEPMEWSVMSLSGTIHSVLITYSDCCTDIHRQTHTSLHIHTKTH